MITSNWRPPTSFPSLKGEKRIAVDVETKDPNLMTKGPGGVRGDGHVIGISVATSGGFSGYYPIRHEGGDNLDEKQVLRWAKDNLEGPEPKVGANIIYDLEWFRHEGIKVGGKKLDIQMAEPLLDENKITYRLEALAQQYLGVGKDETMLIEAAKSYGIPEAKIKENLWKLPARYVGGYGETDAVRALQVFEKQEVLLEKEELVPIFELETRLLDVLLEMRFRGVRVDMDKAEKLREQLLREQLEAQVKVRQLVGTDVDIWSAPEIAAGAQKLGLQFINTDKGNPSFEAEWLESQTEDYFKLIAKARKLDRGGGVFIEKKILELQHKGRVHSVFRQMRSDSGGTRTGRFSSEKPNMQQVPARDPYLAPLIRSLFIPEEGCRWGCFDYSQQEPRVTVHYAYVVGLPGSVEAHRRYNENPDTDYHNLVAEMANIVRKDAKTLNLGLAYGMGKKKLAAQLNRPYSEAMEIYDRYHEHVPYMKLLGERCSRLAESRGWIRTLLGRKRHFNLYGPPRWRDDQKVLPYEDAIREYGHPVIRYFVHKAMNSLIQGSSADMIKKAIVDCYDAGHLIPVTVHDELDSTDIETDQDAREIRDIMTSCVKLEVPLKVDVELGPSWGEAQEVKL